MFNFRFIQYLFCGWVGFFIVLVSLVGLIMVSLVIFIVIIGFGLGGGIFVVVMLVVLLLMLVQFIIFVEVVCLLLICGLVYDYLLCGFGCFFVIIGMLLVYLIVYVFVGIVEIMFSGIMVLVNFELLNIFIELGGSVWLVGVGMVFCFGLLNVLGIIVFGCVEVIFIFGMWSILMIFVVVGLLCLFVVELQGWFGVSMVGDDLLILLLLVGMVMFMFVGCEFVMLLVLEVCYVLWILLWVMVLGLIGVVCCMFFYGVVMCWQVENFDFGGGLYLLEMLMVIL